MGHAPIAPLRLPTALERLKRLYVTTLMTVVVLEERLTYLFRNSLETATTPMPWEVPPRRSDSVLAAVPPGFRGVNVVNDGTVEGVPEPGGLPPAVPPPPDPRLYRIVEFP